MAGFCQRTIIARDLDRIHRFFQTRTRHHHFFHADLARTGDDVHEIVRMCLLAMIDAAKHWIAEIDANLRERKLEPAASGGATGLRTDINVFQPLC